MIVNKNFNVYKIFLCYLFAMDKKQDDKENMTEVLSTRVPPSYKKKFDRVLERLKERQGKVKPADLLRILLIGNDGPMAITDDERAELMSMTAAPVVPGELCTNPEHRKLQLDLDHIFHADAAAGEWIKGNIIMFMRGLLFFSGNPPEGHEFSAEDPIRLTDPAVNVTKANRGVKRVVK